MDTTDEPPLNVAAEVLKDLAPELAPHVHAFLHGGQVGALPLSTDYAEPSVKLRNIHEALSAALMRRKHAYHVAVLAVALRLQSVVLYETIKRHYRVEYASY